MMVMMKSKILLRDVVGAEFPALVELTGYRPCASVNYRQKQRNLGNDRVCLQSMKTLVVNGPLGTSLRIEQLRVGGRNGRVAFKNKLI
jgi:hypothetical protein